MFFTSKRGFTLIELLVVISIIGLLSTVVLSAVNSARAKASDSTKIQALNQLKRAMELYYDNNGGLYPDLPVANTWRNNCWDCVANALAPLDAGRLAALSPYLSDRPQVAPLAKSFWTGGNGYYYKVSTDRKDYKITLGSSNISNTANIPLPMQDTMFAGGGYVYAAVYSSDAAKNWTWSTIP
jgi:prepilin-type N-terminal cleavage/methylation domain-containing protein